MPELIDGFKVGNYFVSFPPNDFIKEDHNGNMYAEVNIYEMTKEGETRLLKKSEITPEIDEMISNELTKMVLEAIKLENNNETE